MPSGKLVVSVKTSVLAGSSVVSVMEAVLAGRDEVTMTVDASSTLVSVINRSDTRVEMMYSVLAGIVDMSTVVEAGSMLVETYVAVIVPGEIETVSAGRVLVKTRVLAGSTDVCVMYCVLGSSVEVRTTVEAGAMLVSVI